MMETRIPGAPSRGGGRPWPGHGFVRDVGRYYNVPSVAWWNEKLGLPLVRLPDLEQLEISHIDGLSTITAVPETQFSRLFLAS